MKTVMKKLLSLMLVAVLLVSAVPFQASAAEYQVTLCPNYPSTEGQAIANVYDDGTIDFNSLTAQVDLSVQWVNVADGSLVYGDTQYAGAATLAPQSVYEAYVASQHTHSHTEVVTAPTCTKDGYTTYTCECGDTFTKAGDPATGHSWGDWVETKPATTAAAGELTRTCATCGETETKEIAKLNATSFTLYFNDGVKVAVIEDVENGEKITKVPQATLKTGYDFKGWYSEEDGKGTKMAANTTWYTGMPQEYYAYYEESLEDGLSTLSVYAKVIVGSTVKDTFKLYDQEFEDGDAMLTWLQNNESYTADKIFAKVSSADYEWAPRYYYNYSGNEPLTAQNLIADGDKSIVVKVYAKEATQANVLLYVHKNTKSSSPAAIYEMSGYTAGDTVTLSAAKTIVKKHYTGSNMTITGLYSDTAWKQLLNGENPTAANGIKVEDNGTMKVHVVIKNATASENGEESDSTNPKTGDMIFVPMIFMLVSAAAIFAVICGKKRMVK